MAIHRIPRGSMDASWKEFFKDPSLWHDNRCTKRDSKSPDNTKRISSEWLWSSGQQNPSWVHEELRRRSVVLNNVNVKDIQDQISNENQKDEFSYMTLLKSCSKQKNLTKGMQLHVDILREGLLKRSPSIASSLIIMYAKCGELARAQKMFDQLTVRNLISWSALIEGYVQQSQFYEALRCFKHMQNEGFHPDAIIFSYILKACGSVGAIEKGKQIHEHILAMGFLGKDPVLGAALVDMYVKCGVLGKALQVLEELPVQSVVAWSALIDGYIQQGQNYDALDCFEQMKHKGILPDAVIFTSILKACGNVGAIDKGKEIHHEIRNNGFLGTDNFLGTALVDMYAKCGMLRKSQDLHDELSLQDRVSWSALIAGYAQQGESDKALDCFKRMQYEGLDLDAITCTCILKACRNVGSISIGRYIHDEIIKRGLLGENMVLANALVGMYATCGVLAKAKEVHYELGVRSLVSWNALITGYAQEGNICEAWKCFEEMQNRGISPNVVTFICILKAIGNAGAIEKGRKIYEEVLSRGLLKKNIPVGNALVDMYVKCGALAEAQQVLKELPIRDVIAWSSLIAGFVQQGFGHEALKCFERMQQEGVHVNSVTFISILKACGSIGAVKQGKQIHDTIFHRGLIENDIALGNALVDMYSKCGEVVRAEEVFDTLLVRNVISWNSVIAGHAQQGHFWEALNCFERMLYEGLLPDEITFLSVLSACTHTGRFEEAQMYFRTMEEKYAIIPNVEHQTCMVAALGSAGLFDKAISVIESMPFSDYLPLWLALLDSCEKWENVKLGVLAFDQAVQIDANCAVTFILMRNIYAAVGMQEDARKIEDLKLKLSLTDFGEPRNCSWTCTDGNVC